ncbi:endonuclease domain-containing protein [Glaciibacter sp. 2TAF33]|uniref:endonuclease domain-containing protein n=1 Tax=Glaciibacter sp. 2TAF33 TaxID=3233015 RepID=UPI003F8F8AE5
MITALNALGALDGVAHTTRLRSAGVSRASLEEAVRTGAVERIRPGWFCRPGDSSDTVRALRVGGRLGCVSLLRVHGVWLMPDPRLHVAVAVARSRLHTPTRRGVALASWPAGPSVVTHWRRKLLDPHEPTDLVDDAAACAATCLPRDHAIVAFDSILNSKLLSANRLRAALAGLPDSHAWMMDLVDAGCGSGLETLVRLNLRRHNVRVRSQAHIPGIGWIDLLVGDRLVVELDSRRHHANPNAYERDRARDLALVERGYIVVRVTYRRVMEDWPAVERALLAVVRRQEHRWQSVHRSAGIAIEAE